MRCGGFGEPGGLVSGKVPELVEGTGAAADGPQYQPVCSECPHAPHGVP